MLKKKDLEKQTTFKQYERNQWFDIPNWDYMIQYEGRGAVFYSHCEVNGDTQFVRILKDFEDLQETYFMETGRELELI